MHKQAVGQCEVGTHQQCGPDDGMELEDVLGHELHRGRPEAAQQVLVGPRVGEGRVVIEEGIHPHVHGVRGIPRHRDAPLHLSAAHREIVKPHLHHAARLVHARLRAHELRHRLVLRKQALLIRRQTEEPVLLFDPLHGALVRGALLPLRQIALVVEGLA